MESLVDIQTCNGFKTINELFIGTISSIACHKNYIIYASGSFCHFIDINQAHKKLSSDYECKYSPALLSINVFDSLKQVEKIKVLPNSTNECFSIAAFTERWIKVYNICESNEILLSELIYENKELLDKIYDIIFIDSIREYYIGFAHNFVLRVLTKATTPEEQTVFKRFSHEYSKAQCEDECILFQLAFHPKEMWSSHQYLVASATMFGSVAVWNYFIDDTLENEKRPVLWEFKGHQGVIYNLRWINDSSFCTTSGDRVINVWDLDDNSKNEVLICRNTAGVLDLENYVADSNKEMMKFEAQIGKSLWCVSSLSNIKSENIEETKSLNSKCIELNTIVTGGADTSIKLWSLNSSQKEETPSEVIRYDYDIKSDISKLPYTIKNHDQYFIRSLCNCIVQRTFYVFAATNIGTIYCWRNEEKEFAEGKQGDIKLELKYFHSSIEQPEIPTSDFSIIDICCTDIMINIGSSERNLIFMVAAFECPQNKHSKCQILMFDRDNECNILSQSKNKDVIIPEFEWMKTAPAPKTEISIEEPNADESKNDEQDDVKEASCKIIRVSLLRKFNDTFELQINEIQPFAELFTTNGRGLSFIWRIYIQRTGENTYEFKLRDIAEYQIKKKGQVFCALLTHQSIGHLLLGDTKGNVHFCDDYPWDIKEDIIEDLNSSDIIQKESAYYYNLHGVDKVTSLGYMNNSKHDVVSTATQKHVKVLRYFKEENKFNVISTLKPGPLSCVLGVNTIGSNPIVVGGKGVMLYLWDLINKQQLFSINCKGWNRHISFALNPTNKSHFFISFSNRNQLTIYYANKEVKQVENECYTIRASLHERETLTVAVLHNTFTDKIYLLTGGEGTELLISEVYKDFVNLHKSLNYHTSSIRAICKKLIFETNDSIKYLVATAGGQMLINLFEIEFSNQEFEIIHLAKYEGLKSDQDFRIMDFDMKLTQDSILFFIASSSGEHHSVVCNRENYKFTKLDSLIFDSALLCIKTVEISESKYISFIGSNKGKLIAVEQEYPSESKAESVLTTNPHQVGINVIDIYKNLICTVSDDQNLVIYNYNSTLGITGFELIHKVYSHHSSIKALRIVPLARFSYHYCFEDQPREPVIIITSSYDQRACVWLYFLSKDETQSSQRPKLIYKFKHTLPDVFDLDTLVYEEFDNHLTTEVDNNIKSALKMMIVFVGKGILIKTLTLS